MLPRSSALEAHAPLKDPSPRLHAPALTLATPGLPPHCLRRSTDEGLSHNQKLQAMLGRVLRAEYSFPTNRQLRCVWTRPLCRTVAVAPLRRHPGAACSAPAAPACALLCAAIAVHVQASMVAQPARTAYSDGVKDLISRILIAEPEKRLSIQVGGKRSATEWPVVAGPTVQHAAFNTAPAAGGGGLAPSLRSMHAPLHPCRQPTPCAPPYLLSGCAGDPASPLVCGGAQPRSTGLQRQHSAAQLREPAAAGGDRGGACA